MHRIGRLWAGCSACSLSAHQTLCAFFNILHGSINGRMEYEFRDGRLYLHRTEEERAPIVTRLARIEGQVRGIRQMIQDDRYCGDEIQQANAVTAAVREVALMIISQHLAAGVRCAIEHTEHQPPLDEMLALLRTALKL